MEEVFKAKITSHPNSLPTHVGETALVDFVLEDRDKASNRVICFFKIRARITKTEGGSAKAVYEGIVTMHRGFVQQHHPVARFVGQRSRRISLLYRLHSKQAFVGVHG